MENTRDRREQNETIGRLPPISWRQANRDLSGEFWNQLGEQAKTLLSEYFQDTERTVDYRRFIGEGNDSLYLGYHWCLCLAENLAEEERNELIQKITQSVFGEAAAEIESIEWEDQRKIIRERAYDTMGTVHRACFLERQLAPFNNKTGQFELPRVDWLNEASFELIDHIFQQWREAQDDHDRLQDVEVNAAMQYLFGIGNDDDLTKANVLHAYDRTSISQAKQWLGEVGDIVGNDPAQALAIGHLTNFEYRQTGELVEMIHNAKTSPPHVLGVNLMPFDSNISQGASLWYEIFNELPEKGTHGLEDEMKDLLRLGPFASAFSWVAQHETSGKPIGYTLASLQKSRDGEEYSMRIHELGVTSDGEAMRVGFRLFEALLKQATALGVKEVDFIARHTTTYRMYQSDRLRKKLLQQTGFTVQEIGDPEERNGEIGHHLLLTMDGEF